MFLGKDRCLYFLNKESIVVSCVLGYLCSKRCNTSPKICKTLLRNLKDICYFNLFCVSPIVGKTVTIIVQLISRKKWFCYGNKIRDNK